MLPRLVADTVQLDRENAPGGVEILLSGSGTSLWCAAIGAYGVQNPYLSSLANGSDG